MQGLILLNKPQNLTSFSAVSAIKRIAQEKRVGHTGTLDPMATGVLPVLLGRATSLSSLLIDADKRYIAGIKLGITTDTDDITGNILSERNVKISDSDIENAVKHFMGKYEQIPPIYSAIKKDGVRLYKLAREGKTTDIPAREIEIFDLKLLSPLNKENVFYVDAYVSKGTYIRSLARDIGDYLGTGATLSSLERNFASGFSISDCVNLEDLTCENISEYILNEEVAVKHLREINVTEKQAVRFCNGGQLGFERIKVKDINPRELFRIKYSNQFLGVGFADCEKSQIGIKCIINYPEV